MRNNLVIYHDKCLDGFASAWLASNYLPGSIEYLPASYGDVTPRDVRDKDVLIIDFSYDRDVIIELENRSKSLALVDHHITAMNELGDLDFCYFDMKRSGCSLFWDWLSTNIAKPRLTKVSEQCPLSTDGQAPWPIKYVEDGDLYKFSFAGTKYVQFTLRSGDLDFHVWDSIYHLGEQEAVKVGKNIEGYHRQLVKSMADDAKIVRFQGSRVPIVNCSLPQLISDVCSELLKRHSCPFSAAWRFSEDGSKIIWSLRSTESGLNVGELAKSNGGGGHNQAAGFFMDTEACLNLITG